MNSSNLTKVVVGLLMPEVHSRSHLNSELSKRSGSGREKIPRTSYYLLIYYLATIKPRTPHTCVHVCTYALVRTIPVHAWMINTSITFSPNQTWYRREQLRYISTIVQILVIIAKHFLSEYFIFLLESL